MATAPFFRVPEAPPGDPEIAEVVLRIQRRFSWADPAPGFVVTGRWGSRTATLYRCRNEAALTPDVVLKVAPGWTAEDAHAVWSEMRRIDHAFLAGRGTTVRVADVLGWTDDPPAVCTNHVTGTDIFFMFADLDHDAWSRTEKDAHGIVAECGRALGAYHSAGPEPSPAAARRAVFELEAASRALCLSAHAVAGITDGLPIAPSFGDFGIHQFRLSETGALYLLDIPLRPSFAPPHRDIAWFLFGLIKILGRENSWRRRRVGPALSDAFCDGYASTGRMDPRTAENKRVTSVYLGRAAIGTAHKRLLEGAYGAALRHGTQWVWRLAAAHVHRSR